MKQQESRFGHAACYCFIPQICYDMKYGKLELEAMVLPMVLPTVLQSFSALVLHPGQLEAIASRLEAIASSHC